MFTASQLFCERLGQHDPCTRLVLHAKRKAERIVQELDFHRQPAFGGRLGEQLIKDLVEIAVKRSLGGKLRHIQRKHPVRLHPVDRPDRFTQRFRRIESGNIRRPPLQKERGEASVKALFGYRLERISASSGRSTAIFRTAGQDSVQLLPVISCDILDIIDIFQPSFDLKGRDTCIQQGFQLAGTVHVLKRKQVFMGDDLRSCRIDHRIGQAAVLGAFPTIGTASAQGGTQVTLPAIADT